MSEIKKTTSSHCEEANLHGINKPNGEPFPCGKLAVKIMRCEKDGRDYAMCEWCADTNTRRGMVEYSYAPEESPLKKKPEQEVQPPAKEVISFEIKNPMEIFCTPNGLDEVINKFEVYVRSIDRDISTPKGRDNIRSIAFDIAKNKKQIEKMGTALTEEWRENTKKVNAEKKRGVERMQLIQDDIRRPLTEWEDKDDARIKKHEEIITFIVAARNEPFDKNLGLESAQIKRLMDNLPEIMNRDWEEFSNRAIQEVDATRLHLDTMYHLSLKMEKDAADLTRLRQEEEERTRAFHKLYDDAEREDIAFNAAAKARKEAEEKADREAQAERDRVENERQEDARKAQKALDDAAAETEAANERTRKANEKAAEDKAALDKVLADALQAAEDAKAEALKKADREKNDAIEKERERIADEKAREDKAAQERERNKAHKSKINNEALSSIQAALDVAAEEGKDPAQMIIIAIAKGVVPHVSIKY